MSEFTGESLDVEQLKERLRRMSDDELVRFGEAACYMCSPKANLNKPALPIFALQLDEVRAEWRRRNSRPSALAE